MQTLTAGSRSDARQELGASAPEARAPCPPLGDFVGGAEVPRLALWDTHSRSGLRPLLAHRGVHRFSMPRAAEPRALLGAQPAHGQSELLAYQTLGFAGSSGDAHGNQ